jgi:predicted TIM-barrel fold metal-dependent hydrolase
MNKEAINSPSIHSMSGISRREMLAVTGSAAITLSTGIAMADEKPGWIDAHSHIWTPDVKSFPLKDGQTADDLKPRSFTDDELMAVASKVGVDRVVLIQHTGYHGFDNSYLVHAWKKHPTRFRVVGMVDDSKPDPGKAMEKLFKQGVTGFRITPFTRGDDVWLDNPGMREMWKTAAKTRQSMCCLINASNLPQVDKMCDANPDTKVVIDHFARVGVSGTIHPKELKALCRIARHKNASVKVSAYYALGKKKPPHADLIPMIKQVYEAFGPKRMMWASDCPYQIQGENNYAASIALIRDRIDFLSKSDREWILRKTAESVFFFV